jgi:hypothetical protein
MGAIDGYGSQADQYEDRVGRLVVADVARQCSLIVVEEGWTFNLIWPQGYELGDGGVFDSNDDLVAEPGALVRVKGSERRNVRGACVDDWSVRVTDATVLEP